MQGKNAVPVTELHAGDIGAVAKLKDTLTGDTLGDKAAPIQYPQVKLAEPAITFAIEPKTRADEDKLGIGIHKLMEEDAMLRFFRDPQTKEFLIAGTGQQHIEVVVSKLKNRYHTEVILKAPKVPYRETIRGRADVQGRHKKQTGGHGQFGDCKIKMEPLPRGGKFEFVNDIFGGAIPRNFIPAVEKGIVEAAAARLSRRLSRRRLQGHPLRRLLSRRGFQRACRSRPPAASPSRKPWSRPSPRCWSRSCSVEITIPDEFAGAIMGDLNSRRGRIQGMDNKAGKTVVKAEVPMAEMLTYGTDLTVDDPGPRQLQHGNGPLRLRARAAAGEDHRRRQGRARRRSGRRGISGACLQVGVRRTIRREPVWSGDHTGSLFLRHRVGRQPEGWLYLITSSAWR